MRVNRLKLDSLLNGLCDLCVAIHPSKQQYWSGITAYDCWACDISKTSCTLDPCEYLMSKATYNFMREYGGDTYIIREVAKGK